MLDLPDDEVHVWWADAHLAPDSWPARLNEVERARWNAYRRADDRARFLTGTALVRGAFSVEFGIAPELVELDRTCPDCGRAHGRVRVAQADPARRIEVSISHSGSWVLLAALRRWQVGVDVERVDPGLDHLALASLALNASESRELTAAPDRAESFARGWVRKEAVVKALGEGLRTPLADFEVSRPDAPAAVIAWPTRPGLAGRLRLFDLGDRGDYRAAVAVLDGRPARVVERDGASLLD